MKKNSKKTNSARPHRLHTESSQEKNRLISLASSIAFGTGGGLLCFSLLVLVISALSLLLKDPHKLSLPLAVAAIYLASFASGFLALKHNKGKDTLICGCVSGILLVLILGVFLSFVPSSSSEQAMGGVLLLRLIALPCSVLGALLASKPSKPKRRKRYKG